MKFENDIVITEVPAAQVVPSQYQSPEVSNNILYREALAIVNSLLSLFPGLFTVVQMGVKFHGGNGTESVYLDAAVAAKTIGNTAPAHWVAWIQTKWGGDVHDLGEFKDRCIWAWQTNQDGDDLDAIVGLVTSIIGLDPVAGGARLSKPEVILSMRSVPETAASLARFAVAQVINSGRG